MKTLQNMSESSPRWVVSIHFTLVRVYLRLTDVWSVFANRGIGVSGLSQEPRTLTKGRVTCFELSLHVHAFTFSNVELRTI